MAAGPAEYDPEALQEDDEGLAGVWFTSLTLLGVSLVSFVYHGYLPKAVRAVLPESALVLVVGIAAGAVLRANDTLHELAAFNPEAFFHFLLPPIILFAGYSLEREHGHVFFSNIGSIMAYAIGGTLISTVVVSLLCYAAAAGGVVQLSLVECFLFGALVSATDPVACIAIFESMHVSDLLFNLVFGESVLNDAVAIVLYRAVNRFTDPGYHVTPGHIFYAFGEFIWVSVASFLIGITVAALYTLALKHLRVRGMLPTLFFFIAGYLAYMASELAQLSGIVTILNYGIFMGHYGYENLDEENKELSYKFAQLLGVTLEAFVFAFIGMSVFGVDGHVVNVAFIVLALLFCFLGRTLNIFPLTKGLNSVRKRKIDLKTQFVVWFAGLRGAIAFALSLDITTEHADLLKTTTLAIVLVTTILIGGATLPLLEGLGIVGAGAEEEEAKAVSQSKMWFLRLDRKVFFPFFVKRENIPDWVGPKDLSGLPANGVNGEGQAAGMLPAGPEAPGGRDEEGGASSGTPAPAVQLQLRRGRTVDSPAEPGSAG